MDVSRGKIDLKRALYSVIILFIITFTQCSTTHTYASAFEDTSVGVSSIRVVPLTVKVVFIGFKSDTIDTSYMMWEGNLPNESVNSIITNGENTGVVFNLTYCFVFASQGFKNQLVNHLEEIGYTIVFYNTRCEREIENTLYDANEVEDWLYDNNAGYGGFPENGYTFIVANLSELPSMSLRQYNDPDTYPPTPHYYNVTNVDQDRGYNHLDRYCMVAWGGHHRFWFLDLSAGPEFWTYEHEAVDHIPIQVARELFDIDIYTPRGKKWLSQYLADYLCEAVYNFAVPQFDFDPIFTKKYNISVNVLDNRTDAEKTKVPINSTVNAKRIKLAYEDLAPYITTNVEIYFISISNYPELLKLIVENYYLPVPELNPESIPYVDLRPIYEYLQENLEEFVSNVSRSEDEFTIPVFAFAFSGNISIAFTTKWGVELLPEEKYLWGVSLGDMNLIGMCQEDFLAGEP